MGVVHRETKENRQVVLYFHEVVFWGYNGACDLKLLL